ncbi:unnamed protein product [Arctogadus glacialis]
MVVRGNSPSTERLVSSGRRAACQADLERGVVAACAGRGARGLGQRWSRRLMLMGLRDRVVFERAEKKDVNREEDDSVMIVLNPTPGVASLADGSVAGEIRHVPFWQHNHLISVPHY